MRSHFLKKFFLLLGAASLLSLFGISNLRAEESTSEAYLRQIVENTNNILQKVNDVPGYLYTLTQMATAFTSADTSDPTISMQGNFTQLGNRLSQNLSAQLTMQQQLNADLLGPTANKTTLPNANDLVYSTLLDKPFQDDPRNPPGKPATTDPVYNYIKNAAGITIHHVMPGAWGGSAADLKRYQNYYNTVMAIQSFNGYILSNQAADKNEFNTLQQTLISQASDPQKWFVHVASENIGYVLRQMLLYQSQIFVLLTQLVQTEKQMVTAQAMTNSVLILNNQLNETMLVAKAQGVNPTG